MSDFAGHSRLLLIDSRVLPNIFLKVLEAKQLLASCQAVSSAEAARMVGISRSAYYKYRDCVFAYDQNPNRIISLHLVLQDKPGVLTALLAAFAQENANILTVNQNIPVSGAALVSVSANVGQMEISLDEFLERLKSIDGIQKIENISNGS